MLGAIPIIADNRIRAAMARGEFDHLAGAGRPLRDLDGHYDPDWWLKQKLQREDLTADDISVAREKRKQSQSAKELMTREEHYDEGMAEFAMAEYEKAIECYRKAVELAPDYFDAWHALGMAYLGANKIPDAIEAGKRAVEINPNDMLAHTSLSMYYMKAGDKATAEKEKGLATVLSWGGKIDQLKDPPKP